MGLVDRTGRRYSKLVVLSFHGMHPKRTSALWLCQCDCGQRAVVSGHSLHSGNTRSCGCLKPQPPAIGARFGRLTVVRRGALRPMPSGDSKSTCVCRCDCGTEKEILSRSLTSGNTVSCGCLRRETRNPNWRHGWSYTPEYRAHRQMLGRCYNSNRPDHENYGGRGITVCAAWRESFDVFIEDMGPKPSPQHSIDRIDNNGGYWCGKCEECARLGRPANCRWATTREQNNNRRPRRWGKRPKCAAVPSDTTIIPT